MINFYEAQKSAILLFIGFVISLSLGERVKSVVMQINTLKTAIFSVANTVRTSVPMASKYGMASIN